MSVSYAPSADDAEVLRQARVNASGILWRGDDPRLAAIVGQAAEAFGVPMACLSILDGTREWLPASHGIDARQVERTHCFYRDVAGSYVGLAPLPHAPSAVFAASAPLIAPSGEQLGALCILDDHPRPALSDRELETLRGFAGILVAEICNEQAKQAYGSWSIDLLVEQIRDAADADREPLMIALDGILRDVERAISARTSR